MQYPGWEPGGAGPVSYFEAVVMAAAKKPAAKKAAPRERAVKAPVSVESAAQSGDQRLALEALRDRLARDLDMAPPQVSAQLAAQLRATLAELAALPAQETKSVVDDIAARRAARRAAAIERNQAAGGR